MYDDYTAIVATSFKTPPCLLDNTTLFALWYFTYTLYLEGLILKPQMLVMSPSRIMLGLPLQCLKCQVWTNGTANEGNI
jgi:hypothetical protein